MDDTFHKALIFTDLHITAPGQTIIGLDPAARFTQALAHALRRHRMRSTSSCLAIWPTPVTPAEYGRLAPLLADCPIPVTVTMGNHDLRAPLRNTFFDAADAGGFLQSALDLGPVRLLILDTHDYDNHAPLEQDGWLCATRLAWLDAELARASDDGRDVVVFCHHPPCPTGFWAMDAIGLAQRGCVAVAPACSAACPAHSSAVISTARYMPPPPIPRVAACRSVSSKAPVIRSR